MALLMKPIKIQISMALDGFLLSRLGINSLIMLKQLTTLQLATL